MYGWAGKVLYVDLTNKGVQINPLCVEEAINFIGGRGLNIKKIFDIRNPIINPFDAQNVICIAPGLFSGTPLGMSSRLHVTTLSCLTGIIGDGNVGGSFAHCLKKAGFDQIIISGKAQKAVYILIENQNVKICDAADLWGKDVWAMTDILKQRHGKHVSVAGIGIAGENLVRVASTMVDKYSSAARGSGGVWGSKYLKAIVVKGSAKVELYNAKKFISLSGADSKFLVNDDVQKNVASVYGSLYGVVNWQPGFRNSAKSLLPHEIPEALTPQSFKKYETGRTGCRNCPVKCKNVYEIPSGRRKGEQGEGLEYECVYCLGTNCGVEDASAVMEMANLCDMHGMDVVSLGNAVAFAKDLFNRGIITEKETQGLDLTWENAEAQVQLVSDTAFARGFGRMIGQGMFVMAKMLGKDAMDYCYHVKGLSRGLHPAGLFSLAHAVATRGADHLRGRSWAAGDNSEESVLSQLKKDGVVSDDAVSSLIFAEQATTLADCFGRCKGAVNTWTAAVPLVWKYPLFKGLAQLASAATGKSFSEQDLKKTAQRISALERAFNALCGITYKDDKIPQNPDLSASEEGKKERAVHNALVQEYYSACGYDRNGLPGRPLLQSLGLDFAADAIESSLPVKAWDGPLID
ncbi:aldehyde ferredoxin oxidoreductase family protein [Desulfobacter curvatus]|uniref:aldehyde ferredoxin oxidoreductase family protein n=1 Tax=Desulfobacter curvatus TaxID=2290 RepID=UPI000364E3FF|nr:aldehyde ferredoxin oxidoreductase C-terminal domain-containing protein [Desulfobacter curvatus]